LSLQGVDLIFGQAGTSQVFGVFIIIINGMEVKAMVFVWRIRHGMRKDWRAELVLGQGHVEVEGLLFEGDGAVASKRERIVDVAHGGYSLLSVDVYISKGEISWSSSKQRTGLTRLAARRDQDGGICFLLKNWEMTGLYGVRKGWRVIIQIGREPGYIPKE
jgi:hypothetical protein